MFSKGVLVVRKLQLMGAAALAVLATATAAQAAHVVVFGPTADVRVGAGAHQGPNLASSSIRIINGAIVQSGFDAGGAVAAGPLTPGATSVWASADQAGVSGALLSAHAHGSASLDQGLLKAVVENSGPNTAGSPLGTATILLSDTLHFNNTSGGDLAFSITYSFDGAMFDPFGGNPTGSASFFLGGCGSCGNDAGAPVRFASNNAPAGGAVRAYFNENGVTGFENSSIQWSTWTSSTGIAGSITAQLLVPTGLTSLGIGADLLISCGGGSDCDFDNTGAFSVSPNPSGLTWTSASGVFLVPGGGAVPEPSTWAMMILGFGAAGVLLRRRRLQPA